MGQAFDRDGNVLGEAYGATKREVFDKLDAVHREAAEIRIRSISDRIDAAESGATEREMPRYKSHKHVWALKIAAIEYDFDQARETNRETDGSATITPEDAGYAPFKVDGAYLRKHTPQVGGYYVVYSDGYKSFSPAQAFEEGYTAL